MREWLKKFWIVSLVLFGVVVLGVVGYFWWPGPSMRANAEVSPSRYMSAAAPTPVTVSKEEVEEVIVTPTRTPTAMPTKTSTRRPTMTKIPPRPTPTRTPTARPTTPMSMVVDTKFGTIAWHAENLVDGSVYGDAPIGGLSEEAGIVAQVWTDKPVTERWVFYIPPHTVAWLSGHRGGTGWWIDPNGGIVADLQKQANELLVRDGEMKTTYVVLPGDADKFRLLTRIQTTTPTMKSTPASSAATATPSAVRERIPSGKDGKADFIKGDEVWGWEITLVSGKKCSGGGCYLPSAPEAGSVKDGVVSPWPNEVPKGTSVWKP